MNKLMEYNGQMHGQGSYKGGQLREHGIIKTDYQHQQEIQQQLLTGLQWISRHTNALLVQNRMKKRAKGLCFWCDENFTFGHKCTHMKLYSLTMEETGEEEETEEE